MPKRSALKARQPQKIDISSAEEAPRARPAGLRVVDDDPYLEPYQDALRWRHERYHELLERIVKSEGSLLEFARGHKYFGFNRGEHEGQPGLWYREWAPGAESLALIGDFNSWDRTANRLQRGEYGVWSLFLQDSDYAERLRHHGRLKVHVIGPSGGTDRIPAYMNRAFYEEQAGAFTGEFWQPEQEYEWKNPVPPMPGAPRVYEAHVGMGLEEQRVGTYREFAAQVLPRIAKSGYNVVQLMAIQEHPYYGSFGYHVSNYFAPSSRFGTPEELKELIDVAHGLGLRVFIDIVHSHAVKNIFDGLNQFDGTDHQYFHAGFRGKHPAWDSCLFDYSRWEVLRFLLSNVRYWLEEFRFDGIRFDGVTSMLFLDHGLDRDFVGYDAYFHGVDEDALIYLKLANQVAHEIRPDAITVAEDMSGMPALGCPVEDGGLGFDYRLAMGVPDYWIKLLKERQDENWQMGELYQTLVNRRRGEKCIAYAESHDQALVGDQTLAFRLMGSDMYWLMSKVVQHNVEIERGLALHKMIRLATFSLAGEGYLNFMGNEFGHPEWIDFPRPGNNYSYAFARRQWSLVDDPILRYHDLAAFDYEMVLLDRELGLLSAPWAKPIWIDEEKHMILCERAGLIFAFNFHPSQSYAHYRLGVAEAADYVVILNTDDLFFGGHGIVAKGQHYPCQGEESHGQAQSIQIYVPSRSAQVLCPRAKLPDHWREYRLR
jgi:1,4-alpha-glucan branching enzyme